MRKPPLAPLVRVFEVIAQSATTGRSDPAFRVFARFTDWIQVDQTAADSIASIDRKLAHVMEAEMRRLVVIEWLGGLGSETASEAVRAVVTRSQPGDLLRPIVCSLLAQAVADGREGLSYALRRDLYSAASRAGHTEVMRLLRSTPAQDVVVDPARLVPRELADVPLGRRRSLAKGNPAKSLLDQLARDSDPIVIRNLLRNPRTTEADVVRMAALRPVSVSTLVEIAASRRFSPRALVRAALARNPFCPTDIAIELVTSLPLTVLREMQADPDIHPETRAQVRCELLRHAR